MDTIPTDRQLRYPILHILGDRQERSDYQVACDSCYLCGYPDYFIETEDFSDNISKGLGWLRSNGYVKSRGNGDGKFNRICSQGTATLRYIGEIDPSSISERRPSSFFERVSDDLARKQCNEGMFYDMGMTLGSGVSANKDSNDQFRFFGTVDMRPGDEKDVCIKFNDKKYPAKLEVIRNTQEHHRLMWGRELCKAFQEMYPASGFLHQYPCMDIENNGDGTYTFNFEGSGSTPVFSIYLENDGLTSEVLCEGGKMQRYGTYYERKKSIRDRVLKDRELVCEACGFDFGKVYGERGEGFIEVHHLKPLSEVGAEHDIDPAQDFALLCSNCHRMVHRRKGSILSVDDLKRIMSENTWEIDQKF